ncbi:MAG: amino acid permease [Gammaproteobacteria bacterium]|nr:amino acid permease [Gammaproteobacteria bacterium]
MKFSPGTAIAVIMANMIGTGVFTSLGFQLQDIQSPFVLIMLWVVGGITALCGALSYAELGAALPRSGGEYNFLSQIYHPGAGFIAGWISATIGFAAPTALAAITFGTYLASVFPDLSATWLAGALIMLLAAAHGGSHRSSSLVQRAFTALKVLLILGFCALAAGFAPEPQPISFVPQAGDGAVLISGAFAVALIYVSYAFTGWNAATYLTGELERPQQTLSAVLLVGTAGVTLLYVLLNATFLWVAPISAMEGKLEVGYIAAQHAFGAGGGAVMGVLLALLLVSTVSAMIMAGPRVLQVMGEDYGVFRLLARTNDDGIPTTAIYAQSALALFFVLSASFERILLFTGFTLSVSAFVTVLGLFVLRVRQPDLARPYRVLGYPFTPLVFLLVTGWTMTFILLQRPVEGLWGIAIIAAGGVFYALSNRRR